MGRHIGIRRWGDGCFHEVEDLEDGYVVEGYFIRWDQVVEVRTWDDGDAPDETGNAEQE
jgi:hypothetical protein